MSVSVNYFNKDYNSIPYNFLTKKYFLKRKKNKYKNFKFLRITNVYSNLYQHKIYTLNYYINFFKSLDNNDLKKFGIHQFYFFNFSGLLKQSLVKNVFMYNLLFKECTDNHLILKKDSYYLHKYTLNSLSSFILTKESKNVIQSYNTNYFIKLNNFKNNLLVLSKTEYLKQLNFSNLIILSFGNIDDNYNKNVLNVYYKR
jgi:hypothetical protein